MKPNRRPDWRYVSAHEYAEECEGDYSKIQFEKDEDSVVKKLVEYLCKVTNRVRARLLRAEFPYIHEAYKLFQAKKNSFSEIWVLEALALGGMPAKNIVDYIFYDDPKFVTTFCLCFYDVRDKDIKKRYINNVRLVCESEANVCDYDYGWKKKAAVNGLAFFISTVLDRKLMGQPELDILDEDKEKLMSLNAHWSLEKRNILGDMIRAEEEVIVEKQNIDIDLTHKKDKQDPAAISNVGKELVSVLDLVNNQIELSRPNENVGASEPRLTKKEK